MFVTGGQKYPVELFTKYLSLSCYDTTDFLGNQYSKWFLDGKNLEEINDLLVNRENSTTAKQYIKQIQSKYPNQTLQVK